jgi:regulator of replication initiation timing
MFKKIKEKTQQKQEKNKTKKTGKKTTKKIPRKKRQKGVLVFVFALGFVVCCFWFCLFLFFMRFSFELF